MSPGTLPMFDGIPWSGSWPVHTAWASDPQCRVLVLLISGVLEGLLAVGCIVFPNGWVKLRVKYNIPKPEWMHFCFSATPTSMTTHKKSHLHRHQNCTWIRLRSESFSQWENWDNVLKGRIYERDAMIVTSYVHVVGVNLKNGIVYSARFGEIISCTGLYLIIRNKFCTPLVL